MRQWFLHPAALGALLVVALGVRLAAAIYFDQRLPAETQFEFGDSDSYWYLGQQLAAGKSFTYRSPDAQVFRMPGYPALLAPLFWIFGSDVSPLAGRVLSAAMGTIAVGLVTGLACILFGKMAGIVAGWFTALYPGAIALSAVVLSEAPFCPAMLTQLILIILAYRAATKRGMIAYGILSGVAAAATIYMRPSWLLFLPFAALWGVVFDARRHRVAAVTSLCLAALTVCLVPWWVRNYRVTGHLVPTTLQVGISLKDGLNPWADGASDLARAEQFYLGEAAPHDATEWQANRRHLHEAASWAVAHPLRVTQLAGIKFLRMWNVVPNEPMFRSWWIKLGVAATYLPLLVLAAIGFVKFAPGRFDYSLCGLPAIYFTLLHMVFVSSIRYREPAMLGLIVLAAGVLVRGKATPCTP